MPAPEDSVSATGADLDPLVLRARAGDRDAFRDLVLATQARLALSIASHLVTRDLLEEVLQETYVTAYEKLDQYRLEGAFLAWLKAIARNRLFLIWRERRRAALITSDALDEVIADDHLADLEEDAADQRAGEVRRLAACLERLPARARTLLERRYRDGHALATLAQNFKRTTAALSVTLFRLRQQVRACIESRQDADLR